MYWVLERKQASMTPILKLGSSAFITKSTSANSSCSKASSDASTCRYSTWVGVPNLSRSRSMARGLASARVTLSKSAVAAARSWPVTNPMAPNPEDIRACSTSVVVVLTVLVVHFFDDSQMDCRFGVSHPFHLVKLLG